MWDHIEQGIFGVLLVSVPVLLANIPMSWQNMTVGAVLGIAWSLVSTYLKSATV